MVLMIVVTAVTRPTVEALRSATLALVHNSVLRRKAERLVVTVPLASLHYQLEMGNLKPALLTAILVIYWSPATTSFGALARTSQGTFLTLFSIQGAFGLRLPMLSSMEQRQVERIYFHDIYYLDHFINATLFSPSDSLNR